MAKQEATLVLKIKEIGAATLKSIPNLLKNVGKAAIAAGAALTGYAASVVALASQGSRFEDLQKSFANLANKQGQDADKMLEKMRELSQGTVSDLNLMKQANQALLLGLPVDKFGEMVQIARAASKATGQSMESMLESITIGLGRQSKLVLDNLGIVFSLEDAYKNYAKTIGKTADQLTDAEKKQAFINEALRIGKQNAEAAGGANLSLADRFEQVKARAENFVTTIGQKLGPAFTYLLDSTNKMFTALEEWVKTSEAMNFFEGMTMAIAVLKNGFIGLGEVIGTVGGYAAVAIQNLLSGQFENAKNIMSAGLDELGTVILERKQILNDELNKIEELHAEKQMQTQKKLSDFIAKTDQNTANKAVATKKAWYDVEQLMGKEREQAQRDSFSRIATLSASNNKTLAAIGKAAALTQIAIDGPQAVTKALAAFPPPVNFIAAGAVGAAVAAQAARVVGIPLAEGGIVQAREGGVQATIGEGGRDEAVIPLDEGLPGLGNNITLNVYGGLLGDRSSAQEFARAVDEELLRLRRTNQSVSFGAIS